MSVEDERGAGSGPSEDPTDLWQAARERGREEVRAIFAGTAAPTARTCAFCGVEAETRFEHCPRCGRSYFSRPPRLGRSARLALGGVALAAAGAAAALAGPALVDFRHASDARRAAVARATVAAERARLRAEQRPHRGDARDLRPTRDAPAAAVLRARQKLVVRLEHAITTDARGRISRGELTGGRVRATRCRPLTRNQTAGDEERLSARIGRWSCVAVTRNVVQDGRTVGLFGIPFVASADFARFTYMWCKDNPTSNPGDISSRLAFVRLDRACLAATGRAFATGYVK